MQPNPNGRRNYSAPKLTTYGDMARFTASGTGGVAESMTTAQPDKVMV